MGLIYYHTSEKLKFGMDSSSNRIKFVEEWLAYNSGEYETNPHKHTYIVTENDIFEGEQIEILFKQLPGWKKITQSR